MSLDRAELRPERLAYTFTETAELLGRSPRTIARMIARGDLHPITIGAARLISAAELVRITTPKGEARRVARDRHQRGISGPDPKKVAAAIDALLRRHR